MTPRAEVEVAGNQGRAALEAIVDNGFEGHVCIPVEVAVDLGLELSGTDVFELADGSRRKEFTFKGTANFLGSKRRVTISLTDGEALIGTRLMSDCKLLIDFPKNKVQLARSAAAPKRPHDQGE